jgi:crossover junction endodeoxyribonuclease RuvC
VARILGIDPGSVVTGWGVVDAEGQRVSRVASGAIHADGDDFPARLKAIHDGVREVCAAHRPDEIAVERVFVNRNADSALKLGQARGAAICATFSSGAILVEYSPREIKQAVVGRGAASKEQVQHMVRTLLGIRAPLEADEADALAAALCHAHGRALRARLDTLAAAAARGRR